MKRKIVFLTSLAVSATVISIGFVSFRMAPMSEEAGLVTFGEPFSVVETGPFYAGYVGSRAMEGGLRYIFSSNGSFDDPKFYLLGLIGNFLFYFSLFAILQGAFQKLFSDRV